MSTHCGPLIWSIDLCYFWLYGQFSVGPTMNHLYWAITRVYGQPTYMVNFQQTTPRPYNWAPVYQGYQYTTLTSLLTVFSFPTTEGRPKLKLKTKASARAVCPIGFWARMVPPTATTTLGVRALKSRPKVMLGIVSVSSHGGLSPLSTFSRFRFVVDDPKTG